MTQYTRQRAESTVSVSAMDISAARRAHREQIVVESLDYDIDAELVCRNPVCVDVADNRWRRVGLVSLGPVEGFTIEQIMSLRDKHVNGTA